MNLSISVIYKLNSYFLINENESHIILNVIFTYRGIIKILS